MLLNEFIDLVNNYGAARTPFLFIIDFEMQNPIVFKIDEIDATEIHYNINGYSNAQRNLLLNSRDTSLKKYPIPIHEYQKKFDTVYNHLNYGDTYLTNLTTKTEIQINHSLREIFWLSHAKYKLLFKDEFLVFSPETFIQIRDGRIFSYPMKGTIDASVPHAYQKILSDQKEMAEHVTIVDLIRNDLSQVASRVTVTKFRFVEEIRTNQKNLLQVSSEIMGELAPDYRQQLGSILVKLLPAGSISGAPKPKTIEVIENSEGEKRGYYTGVMGYFNGISFDSGVMIRFIEKCEEKFFYRSGGGITTQSILETEYQETIDKVYVPFN